jgi:hypothetical protein
MDDTKELTQPKQAEVREIGISIHRVLVVSKEFSKSEDLQAANKNVQRTINQEENEIQML